MAALGAAVDRHWAVPGDIVGRFVAGAAVSGARRRARLVCSAPGRGGLAADLVSLADPRTGPESTRPWFRHPASSCDRIDRHAGDQGPGCAGALAGAAGTYAGLD